MWPLNLGSWVWQTLCRGWTVWQAEFYKPVKFLKMQWVLANVSLGCLPELSPCPMGGPVCHPWPGLTIQRHIWSTPGQTSPGIWNYTKKRGAEMRSHMNLGPGCPFLSWHVCPSTDRQFASQRATDGTLREKGSWQATHLRRRRKSPVFLTFGVQVLETCFCLNNIKYHIFLLRDSVAVCSFQFSEAYDPGQRSSSMFSRSVLPWT